MKKRYMYRVFLVLCTVYCGSVKSIIWTVATRTIVIGNDAKLTCHVDGCDGIKTWNRGEALDLLCVNGDSANEDKYAMINSVSGNSFDLVIKKFSLTDTNLSYSCACGFQRYTNILRLNSINVTYPPKLKQYAITPNNSSLEIQFSMYVYPRPKCEILFEVHNKKIIVPINTIVINSYTEEGIYNVEMRQTISMDLLSCKGTFMYTTICNVGLMNYTIYEKQVRLCREQQSKYSTSNTADIVAIIVIIASGINVVVLVILMEIRENKKTGEPSELDKCVIQGIMLSLLTTNIGSYEEKPKEFQNKTF